MPLNETSALNKHSILFVSFIFQMTSFKIEFNNIMSYIFLCVNNVKNQKAMSFIKGETHTWQW